MVEAADGEAGVDGGACSGGSGRGRPGRGGSAAGGVDRRGLLDGVEGPGRSQRPDLLRDGVEPGVGGAADAGLGR